MRVLYVNHTGLQSGAEIAAIRLLGNLPADVLPIVACPEGPFAQAVRDLGITWKPLPAVEASLSLSPANLVRACAGLARGALALRRVVRESRADLVHALTIRAAILAALCSGRASAPLVVAVQDVLPPSPISRVVVSLLERRAAAIIVDSRYVAERWLGRARGSRSTSIGPPDSRSTRGGSTGSPLLDVVHPPGDPDRFRAPEIDRQSARERLGLRRQGPVIGMVGQITPWKGHDDAIRALRILRERLPSAELAVAGAVLFDSNRYDNPRFDASIRALIAELELSDAVHMLGHRDDVPNVMAALDLLLVPSWEEPFGLVVVEALSCGVPVIATNLGGPGEIITDGLDGRLLPPRSPDLWAREIARLLEDQPLYALMAAAAPAAARRFSPGAHADATVAVYRRSLRPHRATTGEPRRSEPAIPTPASTAPVQGGGAHVA
jgi:glycosyltransferase involved in cell wall biosynthesis